MNQEQALCLLKSGRNVFLTGSAGTGKTYVLNQYIQYLKERKVPVAVTASTGIAASHMNGMTIHSWAGIGIKDQLSKSQINSLKSKKYLKKHLEETAVLILDEISMLHKNQLDLVNEVLQQFRQSNQAFGGIQLVLSGDFYQLPPIGMHGEKSKDKFAFMAKAWVDADLQVCYLTEQYRQSKNQLNEILNQIRNRSLSEENRKHLLDSVNNQPDLPISPTRLYTHNVDVDQMNAIELEKLSGKQKKFLASGKGNEKLVELLKSSTLAMEKLELKIDAKVMFVKNNPERGFVNGSLGKVIDFSEEGFPKIKTTDNKVIEAKPENWSVIDDTGKTLASINQVPLRLAWAITIHKSQGMTLEAASIDLSKTFELGQGYVALSRLKTLENLDLLGFNEMALKVDGLAFKADQRFKELSGIVEKKFSKKQLEEEALYFLKDSGGLTNQKEIEKNKAKLAEKSKLRKSSKKEKESTYAISLMYFKQGHSLAEIAKARGMTKGTIAGHLIKLKKENPTVNFSQYKPKKIVMTAVEAVYKQYKVDDVYQLKGIHQALEGRVSYDDIKCALAFLL